MGICFPFVNVPGRPAKPRASGFTICSDRGLSMRQASDLLETRADILDYVKIVDHVGFLSRYSEEWMREKVQLYASAGVGCFPGGVAFEVCVVQRRVKEYMARLRELGFSAVEVSDDVIRPLEQEDRSNILAMARSNGLKMFTEVGRKDPVTLASVPELVRQVKADLAEGVTKVTIEQSEILLYREKDEAALEEIVKEVGSESLLFEVGGKLEMLAWLFDRFGPELNVENIETDQVIPVEGMRRGFHRLVQYRGVS